MAYYFEHDFADGRHPLDYAAAVVEAAETWQRLDGTVSFRQHDGPDGALVLHDTRPCAVSFQRRLTGLDREIYLFCDTGRSLEAIVQHAAGTPPAQPRSRLDPPPVGRLGRRPVNGLSRRPISELGIKGLSELRPKNNLHL